MKYIIIFFITVSTMMAQKGDLSGVVYYNYQYDFTKDAVNDDSGFSLDRVYLTYQKNISDVLSYKFQADVGQLSTIDDISMTNSGVTFTTKKTQYVMYLKNAKVDWKTSIGKITIGLQGMNVFNVVEKTWGFRFLEKSPMDLHKFSSSADLGLGYSGSISNIHYSFMLTNGSGYKKTDNDKYKKISTQFVYGEKQLFKADGYNAGLIYTLDFYDVDPETTKNKMVFGAFGGYAGHGLRIGGEFDRYIDSGSSITKQIIATYASYKILDNLEGLIYYDMYNANLNAENDSQNYLIAGLNYYATKGLIVTPNIRFTTFANEDDSHIMFKMNFQFKF